MSRKPSETTIKTSIRVRPCSEKEKEVYPGPALVNSVPGEVRLYAKQVIQTAYACSGGGRSRETPTSASRQRPATPTQCASAAAQAAWQAIQQQQVLGSDYQSYPFANVFGPDADNTAVYNGSGCRDIVDSVLGGCNGTIFMYGQTGAGKTYTMDACIRLVLDQLYAAAARDDAEISITISAVELYNEILRCLLSGRENLQLRMAAGGASGGGAAAGVALEGALEQTCRTCAEAAAVVETAKANRAVGETRANARSSRSHLIIRIKVEILQLDSVVGAAGMTESQTAGTSSVAAAPASVTFSLLNLVDLAGSERVDKSGSSDTPLRLREALNINKSLLCLGNVVTALAERSEGRKNIHIPYRDSKLTRLLEDSLGGNAMTALLACITPLPDWHMEQSRATLEFAARAARVVCSPQRNVLKLLPNAPGGDSSELVAALQAEVAALKQLLAQHTDSTSVLQTQAASAAVCSTEAPLFDRPLQSRPWDTCSSNGTDIHCSVLGTAAADETASKQRLSGGSGWASKLRRSLSGGHRPAADGSKAELSLAARRRTTEAVRKHHEPSTSVTSPSRPSASNGSILWKFFNIRGPLADNNRWQGPVESSQPGLPPAGLHSGSHSNLKSAGLLMLSSTSSVSSKLASSGKDTATDSSQQQQQQQVAQPGILTRWATFHGGLMRAGSDGGWAIRSGNNCSSHPLMSTEQQQQQQQQQYYHGSSGTAAAAAAASGEDSSSASSNMQSNSYHIGGSAAALALRDHIIKQLVSALQQKKAELKQLKEQQNTLQRQLEVAQMDSTVSKQKLIELAEGIQSLAAAREEEFVRWKGHLEELEAALHAAQQESLTYRQESLALVHQLTQLQSRYRSLQSDQLRRSTIIQSANNNMLLQSTSQSDGVLSAAAGGVATVQQYSQLGHCISSLLGIEDCLRQLLTHSAAPQTMTGSQPTTPRDMFSHNDIVTDNNDGIMEVTSSLSSPRKQNAGDVPSHAIQTLSTRFDMTSGLVTRASSKTAPAAAGIESVLQQLQGIMPLLKNAAAAAANAAILTTSQLQTKAAGISTLQLQDDNSSNNPASPRIPTAAAAGLSPVAEVPPEKETPAKCVKCESFKPMLAIMQKLKDEVTKLKSALGVRAEQLAAANATSAAMKRDLEESRHQVGSLQERIDELAEELELARAAAQQAAAKATSVTTSAPSPGSTETTTPKPLGAARDAELGHQAAAAAVTAAAAAVDPDVPLMSHDTPLPELHEQILMSWHALALPRSYRTAFVLGHSDNPSAAPWQDRQQCQAHVALLACLHQLQEDHPDAAELQQKLLSEEEGLMDAGLARLNRRDFNALCQRWNVAASSDAATKRKVLLQQLWLPCPAAAAGDHSAASAAACQMCLGTVPAVELAGLMLKCNAVITAATSNALADAAS